MTLCRFQNNLPLTPYTVMAYDSSYHNPETPFSSEKQKINNG